MDNVEMMYPPSPVVTDEGVRGDSQTAIPVAEDEIESHLALGWKLAEPVAETIEEGAQTSDEGEED